MLCCVCIFSVFHLVSCAPEDPYKGNPFLSPSLCLACEFRASERASGWQERFPPAHTPDPHDLQPCVQRSVCLWHVPCLSGSVPGCSQYRQTGLLGAPQLSPSWRKAGQKCSVKFPLRWHLIIAPPSAVPHLFAPLYEHFMNTHDCPKSESLWVTYCGCSGCWRVSRKMGE